MLYRIRGGLFDEFLEHDDGQMGVWIFQFRGQKPFLLRGVTKCLKCYRR
jgi:hypothetical protein